MAREHIVISKQGCDRLLMSILKDIYPEHLVRIRRKGETASYTGADETKLLQTITEAVKLYHATERKE